VSRLSVAVKYAVFAAMATLANLSVQRVSLWIYQAEHSLYVAMFFGTLAGLLVKYELDKRFIFFYMIRTRREDLVKFILYTIMGIFTTLLFWGMELLFDSIFSFEAAKFFGAALGLAAGYTAKFFLDKRFVFRGGRCR
jgi:putative flippase GtrA